MLVVDAWLLLSEPLLFVPDATELLLYRYACEIMPCTSSTYIAKSLNNILICVRIKDNERRIID